MISLNFEIEFGSPQKFHDFLNNKVHESFLLYLLNQFKFFNHDIVPILTQSHGEYDFYSNSTSEQFEATLLLKKNIVEELISNPRIYYSDKFTKWITKETQENLIERLKKKNRKNSIILFNIFPMRHPRISDGIHSLFASDGWDLNIRNILEESIELVKGITIYLVSYNHDDKFLLKQLHPYFFNEFIPFSDPKDIFPIRVKRHSASLK
jgi:hypothetical protein